MKFQRVNNGRSEIERRGWITFDKQHSLAAEVFDGKNDITSVRDGDFLDVHFVPAPVAGQQHPAVGDDKLAVQEPEGLLEQLM